MPDGAGAAKEHTGMHSSRCRRGRGVGAAQAGALPKTALERREWQLFVKAL